MFFLGGGAQLSPAQEVQELLVLELMVQSRGRQFLLLLQPLLVQVSLGGGS